MSLVETYETYRAAQVLTIVSVQLNDMMGGKYGPDSETLERISDLRGMQRGLVGELFYTPDVTERIYDSFTVDRAIDCLATHVNSGEWAASSHERIREWEDEIFSYGGDEGYILSCLDTDIDMALSSLISELNERTASMLETWLEGILS